jgi:hypothetical protein
MCTGIFSSFTNFYAIRWRFFADDRRLLSNIISSDEDAGLQLERALHFAIQ